MKIAPRCPKCRKGYADTVQITGTVTESHCFSDGEHTDSTRTADDFTPQSSTAVCELCGHEWHLRRVLFLADLQEKAEARAERKRR